MRTLRSGVLGLLAAFAVVAMVFGAISVGMQETVSGPEVLQTTRSTLPPPNLTPLTIANPTVFIPSPMVIHQATPTLCPQPLGWEPYLVSAGDELAALSESRGYSLEQILAGNCLISEMIIPDVMIYLPPALEQNAINPTPSGTPACQRPAGWLAYVVKRGDTLTRISVAYRISIWYLKQVNCLLSDTILPGWTIWVPNVATSTLTASPTSTKKPPEPATLTWTFTSTPTITLSLTHTLTSTLTPTSTDTLTLVPTPTVTNTPTPTTTLTDTPTTTPSLPPTLTITPSPIAEP